MSLNFNTKGNLYQTVELTYEEFNQHFGTNQRRMEQIKNALSFFRIFHSCGCQAVYVDGSFVSKKEYPEDINLCFDLTGVDAENIEREFPQFFDVKEIARIYKHLQCHIFYFDETYKRLFNLLSEDRDGNPKGFVKLNLKDPLTYYDQK